MMRLPTTFRYEAPASVREAGRILAGEGPSAAIVAGGTDLWPNMKRRHQTPSVVVSMRRLDALRGVAWRPDGSLRLGATTTLRAVERDAGVRERLPALEAAVVSISTPLLRNMGTIGGNVCLDTRCNYYNQNYEWRRAINFCMKCEGDTCWVAPSSPRCWAVNSSDSVPVFMALGASARLVGPDGVRDVSVDDLFRDDGIEYLTKRKDDVLESLHVPAQDGGRAAYRKVRRRGAFDFPVVGVAARLAFDGDRVREAKIVLNAVGSTPRVCAEADAFLVGRTLTDDVIAEAASMAFKPAKPLDNTDHLHTWRKKMVKVEVRRALEGLRG
jgi:4-hydroxybenzoyl-CoA reductase subunit beta